MATMTESDEPAGRGVRTLSISELERLTGTPRSTIYYYIRDGVLPAAQKAAASRAVYSDVHVDALREIRRLKDEGVPLDEIRERIRPLVERRQAEEPDLVARRTQQTREAILQAAALQFARRGYRRTRIGDIIKEVGITGLSSTPTSAPNSSCSSRRSTSSCTGWVTSSSRRWPMSRTLRSAC